MAGARIGLGVDRGAALGAGATLGACDGAGVGPGVGAARAASGEAVLSTSTPTAARSDRRMDPD